MKKKKYAPENKKVSYKQTGITAKSIDRASFKLGVRVGGKKKVIPNKNPVYVMPDSSELENGIVE